MQLVDLLATTYFQLIGLLNSTGGPLSVFENELLAGVKFIGDTLIQNLGTL
jgi:hypothetical protein